MKKLSAFLLLLVLVCASSSALGATQQQVDDGFAALKADLQSLGIDPDNDIELVDITTVDLCFYCEIFGLFSDSDNGNCFIVDNNATTINDNFPDGGNFTNAFGDPATASPWLPPLPIINLETARFLDHDSNNPQFTNILDALADPNEVLSPTVDDHPNILVFRVLNDIVVDVPQFGVNTQVTLKKYDLIIGYNDSDPSDFDYNDFIVVAKFCAPKGDKPEFDAVGCDADKCFLDCTKELIVRKGLTQDGRKLNCFSDFTELYTDGKVKEFFYTNAGMLFTDPCFDNEIVCPGYKSATTDWWNQGTYTWRIVLQKKPKTDLNISIVDCVLQHNGYEVFGSDFMEGSAQTGRWRAYNGKPMFVESANPTITAKAFPGPFATTGFPLEGLILDARTQPMLNRVALDEKTYTSKGVWTEFIVVAMPQTGETNNSGQREVNLKQGDLIEITIRIPENNSVDISYGSDNVMLQYVGIGVLDYFTDVDCCEPNGQVD